MAAQNPRPTAAQNGDPRQRHLQRAKEAWSKRDRWNKVLLDVYEFVAPHRRSTRLVEGLVQRSDRIFDNHAANALHRVVGRLLEDVFPSGEELIALEPGPAVEEDDLDAARDEAAAISSAINITFWNGDFDNAVAGMVTDGMVSTGFMLMLKGDAQRFVRWVNVPMDEMAIDSGPYDEVHGFFWKRKWTYRAIKEAFPKGNFSRDFLDNEKGKGEDKVTLCQDTIFVPETGDALAHWRFVVYLEGKDGEPFIWEEDFKTCPWICFRYFRLPGEDYGYGPVLMNLPTIKTLNKTTEVALKGAALAALGIYTVINDGVFNPDTARLEPGAMWPVARNGGPLGPSIQRLPPASDANLNMVSIQDMRLMISAGMNDQELPPDGQSPRSAAEIIERTRRLRKNHAGAFSRIVHDVFLAALPRVQEILVDLGVIEKAVRVDQLLVRMKVLSPLGQAFRSRQAEKDVQWLELVNAIGGPQALRMVTPLEKTLAEIGNDMGVAPDRINSVNEQQMLQQRIQEGVAAALEAMKKQGAAPPPPNGDPAQAG